jgi:outer membrane protein OmpA-like peptidoglycan-associated protein
LSQKRAESVVNYLVQKGIAAARLVAKGYGDTMPIAPNDTEESKAKNRRTEVKVL